MPPPTPELDITLCPRIGGVPYLPRGTQTADCSACKCPVWVSPQAQWMQATHAARPMCGPCYERLYGSEQ